jgi:hypothetical protein
MELALILVYSDAAIIVVRNGCTHPTRVLRRAIAVFVGQSLLILVPSIELRKATCASIHVDRAHDGCASDVISHWLTSETPFSSTNTFTACQKRVGHFSATRTLETSSGGER